VGEAMSLVARDGWVMPGLPDIREAIGTLRVEGSSWEGATFRAARELVLAARAVRRLILGAGPGCARLAELAEQLAELLGIPEDIDRIVAEDGSVRDGASPELARLRREIHGARARIDSRLTEYAASLPRPIQVPDASVTIRDGRYVMAVRREGRTEVGGIVHGESQTGATLFVEPPVAIEMMIRLREM